MCVCTLLWLWVLILRNWLGEFCPIQLSRFVFVPQSTKRMWSFLVLKTNRKMLKENSFFLWLRLREVVEYRVQNYRYDYFACYVLCPQSMNVFFQTTPLSRLFSCNAWRKRRIKTCTCIFRTKHYVLYRCYSNGLLRVRFVKLIFFFTFLGKRSFSIINEAIYFVGQSGA